MSDKQHYSYTVYADADTARTFDDRRFGGAIGDIVATRQAEVLVKFAGAISGRSVLDVGTGTGRAALLLAARGAHVTGLDASGEMLAVARRRAEAAGADVTFIVRDAHALEFADRTFDAAVSLRVLMHTPGWRTCIAELCRVADRLVILDYPSAWSFAVLQAAARRVLHALGVRTEPYRVFTHRAIARELEKGGFSIRETHQLFVLPIAFHKALGSRRATEWIEGGLARLGLVRLLGSPVTLVAERCASS